MEDYDPACPTEDDFPEIDLSQVPLPPPPPGSKPKETRSSRRKQTQAPPPEPVPEVEEERKGKKKKKKKRKGGGHGKKHEDESVDYNNGDNEDDNENTDNLSTIQTEKETDNDDDKSKVTNQEPDINPDTEEITSVLPKQEVIKLRSFGLSMPAKSASQATSKLQFKLKTDPESGKAKVSFNLTKSLKRGAFNKLEKDEKVSEIGNAITKDSTDNDKEVDDDDEQEAGLDPAQTASGEVIAMRFQVAKKFEMFRPNMMNDTIAAKVKAINASVAAAAVVSAAIQAAEIGDEGDGKTPFSMSVDESKGEEGKLGMNEDLDKGSEKVLKDELMIGVHEKGEGEKEVDKDVEIEKGRRERNTEEESEKGGRSSRHESKEKEGKKEEGKERDRKRDRSKEKDRRRENSRDRDRRRDSRERDRDRRRDGSRERDRRRETSRERYRRREGSRDRKREDSRERDGKRDNSRERRRRRGDSKERDRKSDASREKDRKMDDSREKERSLDYPKRTGSGKDLTQSLSDRRIVKSRSSRSESRGKSRSKSNSRSPDITKSSGRSARSREDVEKEKEDENEISNVGGRSGRNKVTVTDKKVKSRNVLEEVEEEDGKGKREERISKKEDVHTRSNSVEMEQIKTKEEDKEENATKDEKEKKVCSSVSDEKIKEVEKLDDDVDNLKKKKSSKREKTGKKEEDVDEKKGLKLNIVEAVDDQIYGKSEKIDNSDEVRKAEIENEEDEDVGWFINDLRAVRKSERKKNPKGMNKDLLRMTDDGESTPLYDHGMMEERKDEEKKRKDRRKTNQDDEEEEKEAFKTKRGHRSDSKERETQIASDKKEKEKRSLKKSSARERSNSPKEKERRQERKKEREDISFKDKRTSYRRGRDMSEEDKNSDSDYDRSQDRRKYNTKKQSVLVEERMRKDYRREREEKNSVEEKRKKNVVEKDESSISLGEVFVDLSELPGKSKWEMDEDEEEKGKVSGVEDFDVDEIRSGRDLYPPRSQQRPIMSSRDLERVQGYQSQRISGRFSRWSKPSLTDVELQSREFRERRPKVEDDKKKWKSRKGEETQTDVGNRQRKEEESVSKTDKFVLKDDVDNKDSFNVKDEVNNEKDNKRDMKHLNVSGEAKELKQKSSSSSAEVKESKNIKLVKGSTSDKTFDYISADSVPDISLKRKEKTFDKGNDHVEPKTKNSCSGDNETFKDNEDGKMKKSSLGRKEKDNTSVKSKSSRVSRSSSLSSSDEAEDKSSRNKEVVKSYKKPDKKKIADSIEDDPEATLYYPRDRPDSRASQRSTEKSRKSRSLEKEMVDSNSSRDRRERPNSRASQNSSYTQSRRSRSFEREEIDSTTSLKDKDERLGSRSSNRSRRSRSFEKDNQRSTSARDIKNTSSKTLYQRDSRRSRSFEKEEKRDGRRRSRSFEKEEQKDRKQLRSYEKEEKIDGRRRSRSNEKEEEKYRKQSRSYEKEERYIVSSSSSKEVVQYSSSKSSFSSVDGKKRKSSIDKGNLDSDSSAGKSRSKTFKRKDGKRKRSHSSDIELIDTDKHSKHSNEKRDQQQAATRARSRSIDNEKSDRRNRRSHSGDDERLKVDEEKIRSRRKSRSVSPGPESKKRLIRLRSEDDRDDRSKSKEEEKANDSDASGSEIENEKFGEKDVRKSRSSTPKDDGKDNDGHKKKKKKKKQKHKQKSRDKSKEKDPSKICVDEETNVVGMHTEKNKVWSVSPRKEKDKVDDGTDTKMREDDDLQEVEMDISEEEDAEPKSVMNTPSCLNDKDSDNKNIENNSANSNKTGSIKFSLGTSLSKSKKLLKPVKVSSEFMNDDDSDEDSNRKKGLFLPNRHEDDDILSSVDKKFKKRDKIEPVSLKVSNALTDLTLVSNLSESDNSLSVVGMKNVESENYDPKHKKIEVETKATNIESDDDESERNIEVVKKEVEKPKAPERLKFKYIPLWEMEGEERPSPKHEEKESNAASLSLGLDYDSNSSDTELEKDNSRLSQSDFEMDTVSEEKEQDTVSEFERDTGSLNVISETTKSETNLIQSIPVTKDNTNFKPMTVSSEDVYSPSHPSEDKTSDSSDDFASASLVNKDSNKPSRQIEETPSYELTTESEAYSPSHPSQDYSPSHPSQDNDYDDIDILPVSSHHANKSQATLSYNENVSRPVSLFSNFALIDSTPLSRHGKDSPSVESFRISRFDQTPLLPQGIVVTSAPVIAPAIQVVVPSIQGIVPPIHGVPAPGIVQGISPVQGVAAFKSIFPPPPIPQPQLHHVSQSLQPSLITDSQTSTLSSVSHNHGPNIQEIYSSSSSSSLQTNSQSKSIFPKSPKRPKFSSILTQEPTSTNDQIDAKIILAEAPTSEKVQELKPTPTFKLKYDQNEPELPSSTLNLISDSKSSFPVVSQNIDVMSSLPDLADIPLPGEVLPKPKVKRQTEPKEPLLPANNSTIEQSTPSFKDVEVQLSQSPPSTPLPQQPSVSSNTQALPEDNILSSTSISSSSLLSIPITSTSSISSSTPSSIALSSASATASLLDKKKRFLQSPLAIGLLPKLQAQSPLSIGPLPKLTPVSKENALKSLSDRKQKIGTSIGLSVAPSPTSSTSRIHMVLKNRPLTVSRTVAPGFDDDDDDDEEVVSSGISGNDNTNNPNKTLCEDDNSDKVGNENVISTIDAVTIDESDSFTSKAPSDDLYSVSSNTNVDLINSGSKANQSLGSVFDVNAPPVIGQSIESVTMTYPQQRGDETFVGSIIPSSSSTKKNKSSAEENRSEEVRKEDGNNQERRRKGRFDAKEDGGKRKESGKEAEIEFDLSKVKTEKEDDNGEKTVKSSKKKVEDGKKEKRHKNDRRDSLDREKERERSDKRGREDRKRRRDDNDSGSADKRRSDRDRSRDRSGERERSRMSRDRERRRSRDRSWERDSWKAGSRQYGKRDRRNSRDRSPGSRRYEGYGSRDRDYNGGRGNSGRHKDRSRSRSRDRERGLEKKSFDSHGNASRKRSRERGRSISLDRDSDRSRSRSRDRKSSLSSKRKSTKSTKEDFLDEVSKLDAALSSSSSSTTQSGKLLDSSSYEMNVSMANTEMAMVIDPITSGNVIHTFYPDSGDNGGFYPNPPDQNELNYHPEHPHSHHDQGIMVGNEYPQFPEGHDPHHLQSYQPVQQFDNQWGSQQPMSHDQYDHQQQHFPTGVPPPHQLPPLPPHQQQPQRRTLLPTPVNHHPPQHPHHNQHDMPQFPPQQPFHPQQQQHQQQQQFPPDYQQYHPSQEQPQHDNHSHHHHQLPCHFDEIPLPPHQPPQPPPNNFPSHTDQNPSQFQPQSIPCPQTLPNSNQNFPTLPSSSSSSSSTPPLIPNKPVVTSSSSFIHQQSRQETLNTAPTQTQASKPTRFSGFRVDGKPRKSRFSSPTHSPLVESLSLDTRISNLLNNLNDEGLNKQDMSNSRSLHKSEQESRSSTSRSEERKRKMKEETSLMESMVSSSGVEDTQSAADSEETGSGTDTSSIRPLKVKSRWRRNSEAEAVAVGVTSLTPTDSSKLTDETVSEQKNEADVVKSGNAKVEQEKIEEEKEAEEEKEDLESLQKRPDFPNFEIITENIHLMERKKSKSMKRMQCDCTTSREDRSNDIPACGSDCLNRMLMIECGSRCPCGDHCTNKRFQRKQYSETLPVKTGDKGWGLKAMEDMPDPGTFVMEYVGELLGYDEFVRRTRQYAKTGLVHHYFMALNSDEVVDATLKGSISRFINHSCDPNCETQKWTVNGELRVGFFTVKPINKGEELSFDYQFEHYGEAQKCYCGTEKCRGFIGLVKSSNKAAVSKKKDKRKQKTIFKDELLEEDILKLSSLEGMRNRNHVLELCRVMVRAEKVQHRTDILKILHSTKEPACLRLFLDYHGLSLFWSWMTDINTADYSDDTEEFKLLMLSVLKALPISNKTMLKESKILPTVERWAVAAVAAARKPPPPPPTSSTAPTSQTTSSSSSTTDTETTTTSASTSSSALSSDNVESNSTDTNNEADSIQQPNQEDTEMPTTSSSSPPPTSSSSTSPPPLPLPVSTITPVSILSSTDKSRDGRKKRKVTFAEEHMESEFSPEPDDSDGISSSTLHEECYGEAAPLKDHSLSLVDEGDEGQGNSSASGEADSTSQKEGREEVNPPSSDTDTSDVEYLTKDPLTALASELLCAWSGLKEIFKIPKKERVEERKRTERELDVLAKKDPRRMSDPFAKWKKKRNARPRKRSLDDDEKKSNTPKMSKEEREERRQRFEAQVKAEDELAAQAAAEEMQRQQEEFMRHQQRLMEDPQYFYFHQQQQEQQSFIDEANQLPPQPLLDPVTGQAVVDPNTGQPIMQQTQPPNSSSASTFIDPLTGQTLTQQLDPVTGQPLVDLNGQPILQPLQDPHHTHHQPPHPHHHDPSTIPIDPHTGQPLEHAAIDPHTGQPMVDPNTGQPILDPNTGQPILDPNLAQPILDPNLGQPILDPNTGQPILDPNMGQAILDPNATVFQMPTDHPSHHHLHQHAGQPMDSVMSGGHPAVRPHLHQEILDPHTGFPVRTSSPSPATFMPRQPLNDPSSTSDFTETEEEVPPPPSPPTVPVTKLPPNWKTAKDAEGRVYYYHAFTRQTQWEMPTWDINDSDNEMDLDPMPTDEVIKQSKRKTTTAAADTSSEIAKKYKEQFRSKMSGFIVLCLNPFRKPDCKIGRINTTEDFKYLARKLTHHVMSKELKHCRHVEDLEVNENVKAKAKDYVRKYMSKFGNNYRRSGSSPDFKF